MLAALLAALFSIPISIFAQDTAAAELAQLRKLVEQQNAKIDALSAQIARLSAQFDARSGVSTPAAVAVAPVAPVSPPVPAPAETPAPAAAPAETEFAPTPRVIAAAPKVHIVVKGEALEKIAKIHKTTVAELQKLNNITDPKKLQVGQQLTLPPEKNE